MGSKKQTSVALFLAVSSISAGTAFAKANQATGFSQQVASRSELLAQATQECVPVGEGENCARPRRQKQPTTNPAPNTSQPVTDPAANSGSAKKVLNQIERGDL